ncbi:MAG: 2-oxoacid:acceptor oxidoreductase family protein [Promethearchaeota archaeon]
MAHSKKNGIIEVIFHGRGGQGSITASNLLCEFAFTEGYKDILDIPKIGAERRGAPVQAFSKLSPIDEIKNYCGIADPDYTLIFDFTLLDIPAIASSIRGTVIINAPEFVNFDCLGNVDEIWIVDATGIAIKNGLLISGYPILNTLMLGAYAKISGQYSLETMRKVLYKRFGPDRGKKNFIAAKEAYDKVKKIKGLD